MEKNQRVFIGEDQVVYTPPTPYPKGVDPFLHNYSKGMDTLATQAARKARKATTGATPRGTYTK